MTQQKHKIVLGLDLDDVILQSMPMFVKLANEYATKNKLPQPQNNPFFEIHKRTGWSEELSSKFLFEHIDYIDSNTPLYEGALDVLNYLKQNSFFETKIIAISSRSAMHYDHPYQKTLALLKKHNVPFDKLVVNANNKLEHCLKHGVNFFIDDRHHHCENVAQNPKINTMIMSQDYNLDYTNNLIKRVNNLHEMYTHILDCVIKN